MRHILTNGQMKTADNEAIKEYNIPSAILMENAARSAADYINSILDELGANEQNYINEPLIDIICGSGNNGGDGFALARHLHELYRIRVYWLGEKEKMSPETLNNFISVEKLGIDLIHISSIEKLKQINFSKDCIVDAMIGVGGSENIKGLALDILKKIKQSKALKIAIDAPTGLNTSTGIANEHCFEADFTITMFAEKTGMMINSGPDVCGSVLTAYLGAPEKIIEKFSNIHVLENDDIRNILPERKRISSKFDYGRVLVIAGSKKFPGAGALSANAAIIAGAGLVHLHTSKIHHSLLPEVIPFELPETKSGSIAEKSFKTLINEAKKSNVIVLGPGLSDDKETIELVKKLIKEFSGKKKMVLDADALKAIDKKSKLEKNIIITPHTGEFSKITGITRKQIEKNSFDLAVEWAKKLNCTIVLKHVPVIITDGKESFLTVNGNCGMASAGSGDVLTGLIGGLLAQGVEPIFAASLASFIQAKAGDLYVGQFSQETLTASALLDFVPEVLSYK